MVALFTIACTCMRVLAHIRQTCSAYQIGKVLSYQMQHTHQNDCTRMPPKTPLTSAHSEASLLFRVFLSFFSQARLSQARRMTEHKDRDAQGPKATAQRVGAGQTLWLEKQRGGPRKKYLSRRVGFHSLFLASHCPFSFISFIYIQPRLAPHSQLSLIPRENKNKNR